MAATPITDGTDGVGRQIALGDDLKGTGDVRSGTAKKKWNVKNVKH